MQPDLIVIGGGVVGAACARALAVRGLTVTILDGGPEPGAATLAAAGMLAPFAEARPDDPALRLAVQARDLYARLAPALAEETGIDIGLTSDGILQVAFTDEDVVRLRNAASWQRAAGFPVEWLTIDDVQALAPGVGPVVLGAALAPGDGSVDPVALRRALLESAQRRVRATIVPEHAEEILVSAGRVTGVRTRSGLRPAGGAVLAAGCWSPLVLGVPRPLPIEPIRGQMLALAWPEGEPARIVYGGGGYVVPRNGEAVCGSTMERAGFAPLTTAAGLDRILGAAARIYPALARQAIRRSWAGLRPVTPDGRPIIGRDAAIPNLWYATGHGRNGILFAALTGEAIARLYEGEIGGYDLRSVDPRRLWRE